jgi:hypothetical protein
MSFDVQVSQFRRRALEKIDNVYRASIRDVIDEATQTQPSVSETGTFVVGKLPVLTGRLAESLFVAINGSMRLNQRTAYRRSVDKVKATDRVSFGWTAPYAATIEYGGGPIEGRFFATNAVRKWNSIVRRNAKRFGN